jgi:hypothetical protein
MEVLAILVLGISAFLSFSTTERKPKPQTNINHKDDPDWAFTQAYDSDGSSGKG